MLTNSKIISDEEASSRKLKDKEEKQYLMQIKFKLYTTSTEI